MTGVVILIVLVCLVVWLVKRPATRSAERPVKVGVVDAEISGGMFPTPVDAYGAELLQRSYWRVMRELQGLSESIDLLQAVMPDFLEALGDSARASRLLNEKLIGIDWDWPQWHKFAKRRGYSTVPEVTGMVDALDLPALLNRLVKADLVALASSLTVVLPMSLKKTEMIDRLVALDPSSFVAWITNARSELRAKEIQKVRREMGRFLASRVSAVAYGEIRREQCVDPGITRLHPFWRFICPNDGDTPAPKRCRELDQKVLPAAQAMQKFPTLPCDRLDCQCRITTQRHIESHFNHKE